MDAILFFCYYLLCFFLCRFVFMLQGSMLCVLQGSSLVVSTAGSSIVSG